MKVTSCMESKVMDRLRVAVPEVIDIGQCLVLGYKRKQFKIKNTGGKGKFAIVPREAWPSTNFKVASDLRVTQRSIMRNSVFVEDREQRQCSVAAISIATGSFGTG